MVLARHLGSINADLEFLNIETGSDDDTVFYDADNANGSTSGDGASISTSSGNDRIYMSDGSSDFTALDITGLGDQDNVQLFGASLQVEIDGVLSEWVDVDYDQGSYYH